MHGGNVWRGMQPEQWLDFSANLRPEGPPKWVLAVLEDVSSYVRYYPDCSMRDAQQGLADFLHVDPSCVLPTAGGIEALDLLLSLQHGTVFTVAYTFSEYAGRAKVQKRNTAIWNHKSHSGDTFVLGNPNNPDGGVMPPEKVLSLHEKLMSLETNLIIDEAFIHYCPEYTLVPHLRSGLAIAGSLTKILDIPGVRLGYICALPDVIEQLKVRQLPWSLNAYASAIAAHLAEHEDVFYKDARRNQRRRATFQDALTQLGAKVYPSEANYLLADFGQDMTEVIRELEDRHILVRSCTSFGLPTSYLRFAVRSDDENTFLISQLRQLIGNKT